MQYIIYYLLLLLLEIKLGMVISMGTINQELFFEKYHQGTLSYLLLKPDLLSGTGYKVLQGQERAGFTSCVRVIDNGREKLVYDTDGFQPLSQMLSAMKPDEFCVVVAGILHAFQSVWQVGFLNPDNIVCDASRVFVEPGSFAVRLIYLPVSRVDIFDADSFSAMKSMLAGAIATSPHLDSEKVRQLSALLNDANVSSEQLRACLGDVLIPKQTAVSQVNATTSINGTIDMGTATGLVSMTGTIATSSELSGNLSAETDETQQEPVVEKPEKPTSLFGGRKRTTTKPEPVVAFEESGTEVLDDIFVPVIVLEGANTPKKIEFLVNKQSYIIGKKAEAVDGLIDFSAAVSRVHCRINCNDGKNFVTDLGSANGTFVNGKKLEPEKPVIVNEGDKVKLADVTFMVKAI